jgi:hypothetical protein
LQKTYGAQSGESGDYFTLSVPAWNLAIHVRFLSFLPVARWLKAASQRLVEAPRAFVSQFRRKRNGNAQRFFSRSGEF